MISVDHIPEIHCERISLLSTAYISTKPNGLGFGSRYLIVLISCDIIVSMPWHLTHDRSPYLVYPHPHPHGRLTNEIGIKCIY